MTLDLKLNGANTTSSNFRCLTIADFRKSESIPLGVGLSGVLFIENLPAGSFIEKTGHTDIGNILIP